MVFSSIPVYLDPPNWHQQQQNQLRPSTTDQNQLPPLPPPVPLPPHVEGVAGSGPGGGSIRPGSMADRARLAKLPQPETALKCPRCESTNTKFCYFNNYSLTQPRHFCKTCRRYWTRGGALRNVPVGGGCRRNKKSKSNNSRSKSPASSADNNNNNNNKVQTAAGGTTSSNPTSGSGELIGHLAVQPQTHSSFMASIQNLARFGGGTIGLNFGHEIHPEVVPTTDLGFQMSEADQWRGLPQFPFLGAGGGGGHEFESLGNLYPFQSGTSTNTDHHHQAGVHDHQAVGEIIRSTMSSSSRVSQFPPVKIEDHHQRQLGLNLLRANDHNINSNNNNNNLGIMSDNNINNHYWGSTSGNANGNGHITTAWTDLSASLNSSSSTSHLL